MQKCCTPQIKLVSRFVPLHVINSEFHAEALSNRAVQCTQYKGKSHGAALRAHTRPRDRTRPLTTPLLMTQFFLSTWCSSRQNKALCSVTPSLRCPVFPKSGTEAPQHWSGHRDLLSHCAIQRRTVVHSHSTSTDKAAPKDEWLGLQSWAKKLRWQIKFHPISGSMSVPGIISMQAGRDDISDSFRINRRKESYCQKETVGFNF